MTEQSLLDCVNLIQHQQLAGFSALVPVVHTAQVSSFPRGLPSLLQSSVCCCGQGQTWVLFLSLTQPCPWNLLLRDAWQGPSQLLWACTPCAPAHVGRPHGQGELGRGEHAAAPAVSPHAPGGGEVWLDLISYLHVCKGCDALLKITYSKYFTSNCVKTNITNMQVPTTRVKK